MYVRYKSLNGSYADNLILFSHSHNFGKSSVFSPPTYQKHCLTIQSNFQRICPGIGFSTLLLKPSRYTCCQGYICTGCMSSTDDIARSCPWPCLCMEALFCNSCAVSSTRMFVQDERQIITDPCDNRIIVRLFSSTWPSIALSPSALTFSFP